jgi:DNA-binding response OmpR family regulator
MKLLIIEDNPRLSEKMKQQLQKWYIVEIANSGDEGLRLVSTKSFDIVLLDLGLPDIPGIEVCKQIRQLTSETPILVITGIDTTESRVDLLDNGADDYITKPFDLSELRSRIGALARRSLRSKSIPLLKVGDLVIDPASRKVMRDNTSIYLRKKEFDILEYLVVNTGRVLSRQMIINHAWPVTTTSWTGSVDVHIKQLRDKVDRPFSYPLIKTSYGVGYMVDLPIGIKNKE